MSQSKDKFNILKVFVCSLILFQFSCVSQKYVERPQAITIMTYNVENLFDNLDDPEKEDETYLPIEVKRSGRHKKTCAKLSKSHYIKQCLSSDWSDKKINTKLKRLADVIFQVKNGKGPDILVLQEVENLNILERLRINYLQKAGYEKSIIIEGPDERGIDVAILSRIPLAKEAKLNLIDLSSIDEDSLGPEEDLRSEDRPQKASLSKRVKKETRATRGILQAQFKLPDGKPLTVFACHFPSQGSPTPFRRKAIETLNALKAKIPEGEFVIAAGDFNITTEEDATEKLISKDLGDQWLVSHQIGCDDCQGTHNYRGSWSFLDLILFSKNFKGGNWIVDTKSIHVANKSLYQLNRFGGPARFDDGINQKGVSDHFPLVVEIMPRGEK